MNQGETTAKTSTIGKSEPDAIKTKNRKLGFSLWQILLPVGISLLVVALLMRENITADSFESFVLTRRSMTGIGLAIIAWGVQNLAMGHRYYMLAYPYMNKRGALRVTFLVDFASAVTPSAVGGSSVAFLFMGREGVSVGRATAITIGGLFLDELLMSLIGVFLLFFVHKGLGIEDIPALSVGIYITLVLVTVILSVWTLALFISLFHKPAWVGNFFLWVTSWKPLRRWRGGAEKLKSDLLMASQEMRNMDGWYWVKLFGTTVVSWGARFTIACLLVYGFSTMDVDWMVAYIRQMAIWLLAIIIPTPGGSGFSEYMFQVAYVDYFPNPAIALMVALVWRTITSFSYLVIGPIILTFQLRRKRPVYNTR